MVVQAMLDSFSRCFGAPGQNISGRPQAGESSGHNSLSYTVSGSASPGNPSNRYDDDVEALDNRRRTGKALGIELGDKEWDALFTEEKGKRSNSYRGDKNDSEHSRRNSKKPDREVEYADVLAKAKEAADPSRHATPRKIDRKNDIFRSKATPPNPSLAYRILGTGTVARALCFANPVFDSGNNNGIAKVDTYGGNTVNTAEDTLTSTVCFEAKHSHLVEKRPPMPLFNRYKVECDAIKDDTLIGIVKSGSHQSVHMLRAFQEHEQRNNGHITQILNNSSNSNSSKSKKSQSVYGLNDSERTRKVKHREIEEQPPGMQAISENSSSASTIDPSTRSTASGHQNSARAQVI